MESFLIELKSNWWNTLCIAKIKTGNVNLVNIPGDSSCEWILAFLFFSTILKKEGRESGFVVTHKKAWAHLKTRSRPWINSIHLSKFRCACWRNGLGFWKTCWKNTRLTMMYFGYNDGSRKTFASVNEELFIVTCPKYSLTSCNY